MVNDGEMTQIAGTTGSALEFRIAWTWPLAVARSTLVFKYALVWVCHALRHVYGHSHLLDDSDLRAIVFVIGWKR